MEISAPDSPTLLIQSCLEEAGELVTLRSYVTFGTADVKAMAQFRSKNEIIELEPAFIEEIKKRGRSWLEEKAAEQAAKGNPWARDIAGSYFAFQEAWETNSSYRVR